jgi:hypothetical protein
MITTAALLVPTLANGEYFFTANDAMITPCMYTAVSDKDALRAKLESAYGVSCTAQEDNQGTVIVTCKANLTNMIFAAKTIETCNSLRESVKSIVGQ